MEGGKQIMLNKKQIGKLWEQLGTMDNFERDQGKKDSLGRPSESDRGVQQLMLEAIGTFRF